MGIIVPEMILFEPKGAFPTFFIVQSSKENARYMIQTKSRGKWKCKPPLQNGASRHEANSDDGNQFQPQRGIRRCCNIKQSME
jgi:hypothetical protein